MFPRKEIKMDLTNAQYTKIKTKLPIIEELIIQALGETKYQDRLDKIGFAGLVLSAPTTKDPAKLFYVYTQDGENGVLIPFPKGKLTAIRNLINKNG